MKNIITYLFESILDDEHIKPIDRKNERGFARYFQPNDICLRVNHYISNKKNVVVLKIAKIKHVTERGIQYYETAQNLKTGEWEIQPNVKKMAAKNQDNIKYPYTGGEMESSILLPEHLSQKAAQMIINDGILTSDYYLNLYYEPYSKKQSIVCCYDVEKSKKSPYIELKPMPTEMANNILKDLI